VDEEVASGGQIMFRRAERDGFRRVADGVDQKTLVHGERTLLAEFHLAGGHGLPRHTHPFEQTGYLVSGRLRFHIAAESFDAGPGDSWCIAAGVEHGADVVADAVVVEVFSPAREDYLPAR
jgi:quercetin dioxygenase-like cupin family protein